MSSRFPMKHRIPLPLHAAYRKRQEQLDDLRPVRVRFATGEVVTRPTWWVRKYNNIAKHTRQPLLEVILEPSTKA